MIVRLEGAYRTLATYYTSDFEPQSFRQFDLAAHVEIAWGTAFSMVVEASHVRLVGDPQNLV
jgi:hypothetical protein